LSKERNRANLSVTLVRSKPASSATHSQSALERQTDNIGRRRPIGSGDRECAFCASGRLRSAINASSVADGALATISDDAQNLYTLSVAANNDLLSSSERADLQTEANQITQQVNSTTSNAQFNGLELLDGSTSTASVQTGASQGSTAALSLPSSGASALGLSNIDLSSSASATTSESSADAAITTLSNSQATLGSQTVALQYDQQNSANASNNLTAGASNIADADITQTATTNAQEQTVAQIQVALQVQANLAASSILGLFGR
jgi:flagellin